MVLDSKSRSQFIVQADNSPNTLPRVLELFSIRDLTCENVSARNSQDGTQRIELIYNDLDLAQGDILLRKLRSIFCVRSARLEVTLLNTKKLKAA